MRIAALLIATALAGCVNIPASPPTMKSDSGPPAASDYVRTTLIVADMDASIALYRDALGLTLMGDRPISTDAISAPSTGEPGAAARFAMLRGPDTARGMLGLIQWTDPPMPNKDAYEARLSHGSVVLVMKVADAANACTSAAAIAGVTVTAALREASYSGATGSKPIRSLGCTFFDPDGNLVELSQRLAD